MNKSRDCNDRPIEYVAACTRALETYKDGQCVNYPDSCIVCVMRDGEMTNYEPKEER